MAKPLAVGAVISLSTPPAGGFAGSVGTPLWYSGNAKTHS